ncbi:hypothetical protein [Idiomarina abyssalis]|uniref:hypothetical protein n=1 Tax=Idiomarina abyssalis TaxID=86102 RepID=UPI003A95A2AC
MKKILIVDTSYPINNRTNKFRKSFLNDFDVAVLTWDRSGNKKETPPGFFLFKMRAEIGNRLKKLFLLPLFIVFGFRSFRKFKPDVLFVSHWDSLVLGGLIKFFNRRVKLVYDCLDMPSSSSKFVEKQLAKLEASFLKNTDLTIYASRYFPERYNDVDEYVVFENYPSAALLEKTSEVPEWYSSIKKAKEANETIVSWVGVVRFPSVLEKLIESFRDLNMKLIFFGDGPSVDFAKREVARKGLYDKVLFKGRYSQQQLPYIYEVSDLIWAAYPTDNINAVYAISNKFFECAIFEKTPVISSGTRMADDFRKFFPKSAVLVDEFDPDDIRRKLTDKANTKSEFQNYQETIFWEERSKELNCLIDRL